MLMTGATFCQIIHCISFVSHQGKAEFVFSTNGVLATIINNCHARFAKKNIPRLSLMAKCLLHCFWSVNLANSDSHVRKHDCWPPFGRVHYFNTILWKILCNNSNNQTSLWSIPTHVYLYWYDPCAADRWESSASVFFYSLFQWCSVAPIEQASRPSSHGL